MRSLVLAAAATAASAGNPFSCTPVAPRIPKPKDASELHPGHVSVVMAMGDSISAAFTAKGGLVENRDLSWSIGVGHPDQLTMPYILSNTTKAPAVGLEGFSTEEHLPELHGEPHIYPNKDHLNAAQSSAVSKDLLDQQVPYLVSQGSKLSDFENRWKVLTIWIGANDLCGSCHSDADTKNKADQYADHLDQVLAAVTGNFTNIYVNLVSTLNLTSLEPIQQGKFGCKHVQKTVDECGCVSKPTPTKLSLLNDAVTVFNAKLPVLAKKYNRVRPDVAVKSQDFMSGQNIPGWSWLSTLDCFHPSAKAHQSLGVNLWNAMLGSTSKWVPEAPVMCPTPDSVLSS